MLFLRLYKRNEFQFAVRIDSTAFRIGRGKEADLHIEDPSLSKIHLILRTNETKNEWSLQDCSQNGVKRGDQLLPQRVLPIQENQNYQLSKTWSLQLSSSKQALEKQSPTLIHSRRPTQLLEWNEQENQLEVKRALLKFQDSSKRKIERYITNDGLSLGRHPSNDIVLKDESISQFHARFEIRANQLLVTDLGSTNGTRLNRSLVISAQIKESSKLELGQIPFEVVLEKESKTLETPKGDHFFGMSSTHPKMRRVFSLIETVAPTEASVLIRGESGTGKELAAHAIHELSKRAEERFLAINCAAIPKDLLESELFGHVKGAFSGAHEARSGAFETADGGTLFLDEIGELSDELQAKLLRVLESGEVKRLGSDEVKTVDVRILSATHQDLAQLVKQDRFRSDLYFRLHVIPVELPPLRERLRDLDLLVPEMIKALSLEIEFSKAAFERLSRYDFPGNVRELKNIIQRASILARIDGRKQNDKLLVGEDHLLFLDELSRARIKPKPEDIAEKQKILSALESNSFNQSRAAKDLGLAVSTLHDRIRRLRIDIPRKRRVS